MTSAILAILSLLVVDSAVAKSGVAEWPESVIPRNVEAGVYLTDVHGMTLYVYEGDQTPGKSECEGECAVSWPPLIVKDEPENDPWSVVQREDDTLQLSWLEKPLYRSVKDTHPGSKIGADRGGIWRPAFIPLDMPAGFTLKQTLVGRTLSDARGITLYWKGDLGPDAKNISDDARAPSSWSPYAAPMIAAAEKPWSIIHGDDGTRQWAYAGKPLYRYSKDKDAGDVKGFGVDGVWGAAALEPPPPKPEWVTVQVIKIGKAFANAQGQTLYAARNFDQIKREKTCLGDCLTTYMQPVLADSNDKPEGNWSILSNDFDQQQWAFNGALLFTHVRDQKPGDSEGHGVGVGQGIYGGFQPVMQTEILRP